MIDAFSGKVADYVPFVQARNRYLAETQATGVKQLMGLSDNDYALQADPNPQVWDRRSSSHTKCHRCYEKDGALWHVIPDVSAAGKEKQKKEATDMRYGTALIDACAEGTAAWITKTKSDEGKGSKIATRLDAEYADAAVYAWDKYQKRLMAVKLVPDMRRIDTLMQWRNDTMTIYQEMVELADNNSATLKPLLQNEQLSNGNVDQRQRTAETERCHPLENNEKPENAARVFQSDDRIRSDGRLARGR